MQPVQSISEIVLRTIRKALQNPFRVTLENNREQLLGCRRVGEVIGYPIMCIHVACMPVNHAVGNGTLCNQTIYKEPWPSGREKQTGEGKETRNGKGNRGFYGLRNPRPLQKYAKDGAPGSIDFPHNEKRVAWATRRRWPRLRKLSPAGCRLRRENSFCERGRGRTWCGSS